MPRVPKILKKNLVFLMYGPHGDTVQVTKRVPGGVHLARLSRGLWEIGREEHSVGLGFRGRPGYLRRGVIGVYDRTRIDHLNALVLHARAALDGSVLVPPDWRAGYRGSDDQQGQP